MNDEFNDERDGEERHKRENTARCFFSPSSSKLEIQQMQKGMIENREQQG